MKLYEKLSSLRKERGYTQERLAKELNVTRQTVSKWEIGISEPSLDVLCKLADIYGCSVDELLERNIETEETENNSKNSDDTRLPAGYKEPFWNIYKHAFLVITLGAAFAVIYYLTHKLSSSPPSIVIFIGVEVPIFLVSTIVAAIGDDRVKTKGGLLDLLLPLITVAVAQLVLGVMFEA